MLSSKVLVCGRSPAPELDLLQHFLAKAEGNPWEGFRGCLGAKVGGSGRGCGAAMQRLNAGAGSSVSFAECSQENRS